MNLFEIEELFKKEDFDGVIENIKGDIKQVEYYSTIMKEQQTDNGEDVTKAINELTGIFMSMKTVLAIASTAKKNKELGVYVNLRTEATNRGDKFVATIGDKEASLAVAEYRRIKNIVESYVEACNKAISTLQSVLKKITAEIPLQNK